MNNDDSFEQTVEDNWLDNADIPDELLDLDLKANKSPARSNVVSSELEDGQWPLRPCGLETRGHEIDQNKLLHWIYPVNLPMRSYQFNMVRAALLRNTLVSLPTGLGKTFIAAVIMFNYYEWFPNGKIVFMAPTRPLVAQQIEACYKITGLSENDLCELTGQAKSEQRRELWQQKRIFFITPQVMSNDLKTGIFPSTQLVLLVVDEAHRAQGNYAYCESVKALDSTAVPLHYRVLALSATPGAELGQVQLVVDALKIANVELRTEASLDVKPYIHGCEKEVRVLELSPHIKELKALFGQILTPLLGQLMSQRAFYSADPEQASKYSLILSREKFRKRNFQNRNPANIALTSSVEGLFGVLISLCSFYHLLQSHGITSFGSSFQGYIDEIRSAPKISKAKRDLLSNRLVRQVLDQVAAKKAVPGFVSHPKIKELERAVVDHFHGLSADEAAGSRVMVFSQYRESVDEIAALLEAHSPLIRSTIFVGQSSSRNNKRGMVQRQQLETVRLFKDGAFNVLVATSIGEEGLDIGEVDLIVCFDSQSSPIQNLQRMGRTGRKRQGRVIVLVTAGKEQAAYAKSVSSYKSVQKGLADKSKLRLFDQNPAMLPLGARPTLRQVIVKEPETPLVSRIAVSKRRLVDKLDDGSASPFLSPKEYSDYLLRYVVSRPARVSVSGILKGQANVQRGKYISPCPRRLSYVQLMRKCVLLSIEDAEDLALLQTNFNPDDVELVDNCEQLRAADSKRGSSLARSSNTVILSSDSDSAEFQFDDSFEKIFLQDANIPFSDSINGAVSVSGINECRTAPIEVIVPLSPVDNVINPVFEADARETHHDNATAICSQKHTVFHGTEPKNVKENINSAPVIRVETGGVLDYADNLVCFQENELSNAKTLMSVLKQRLVGSVAANGPALDEMAQSDSMSMDSFSMDWSEVDKEMDIIEQRQPAASQSSDVSSAATSAGISVPGDERLRRLLEKRQERFERPPPRQRSEIAAAVARRSGTLKFVRERRERVAVRSKFVDIEADVESGASADETSFGHSQDAGSVASFVVDDDHVSYATGSSQPTSFVHHLSQDTFGLVGKYKLQYKRLGNVSSSPVTDRPMQSESDLSGFVVSDDVIEHASELSVDGILDY